MDSFAQRTRKHEEHRQYGNYSYDLNVDMSSICLPHGNSRLRDDLKFLNLRINALQKDNEELLKSQTMDKENIGCINKPLGLAREQSQKFLMAHVKVL